MALSAIVATVGTQPVHAQQGGPYARLKNAAKFIDEGKWQEALSEVQTAITVFDKRAKQLNIGDKFGQFWYVKGLCEVNLHQYEDAIKSFQQGIQKYPGKGNAYINSSYLKMAEAAIALNDFDQALGYLNSFIDNRLKTPAAELSPLEKNINLGLIYALAAQCHLRAKTPNFEEGVKNIKLIAKNRYKGQGIPDTPIVQAFLALADKSIANNKPEIVLDFLTDSRSVVALEPWRMIPFTPMLLKLAGDAQSKSNMTEGKIAEDMTQVSQELMTLVPDMAALNQSVNDVTSRLGTFPGIVDTTVLYNKADIQKSLKNFKDSAVENKQTPEAILLMLTASQFVKDGVYPPAQAAYKKLHEEYKDLTPEMRENNLYNLIMITATMGDMKSSQALTKEFITDFPQSEKKKVLNSMTLETLFLEQRFEECARQAAEILAMKPEDPKVLEMAMFTEGASLASLNRFREARPKLEAFVKEFPDSVHTSQIMYYHGLAVKRTDTPDKAAHTYSKFVDKFPNKKDSAYLPYVLLDRGICYFNVGTAESEAKALADYDRLIKEFPESNIYPSAQLNKGILLEKQRDDKGAEQAYKEALAGAKKLDNKPAQGEALFHLTVIANRNKKNDEAVAYYDEFWKNFAKDDTVFTRIQEAVEGFPSLDKANRREEAIQRLAEAIVSTSRVNPDQENPLVEMAVNNYTKEYVKDKLGKNQKARLNLEEARNHYYNFPGLKETDTNLITILRMALVGIYEDELKKIDKADTAAIATLEAQIKVAFQDIQKSFKIDKMTPFALVKLGTYLGERSNHPDEAVPYFEELLKRQNQKYENNAIFGLAQALGRSKDKNNVIKAIGMMEKVITSEKAKKKPDRKVVEKAEYNLTQFFIANSDYKKAIDMSYEYLKDTANNQFRPQMSMLWAEANDKAGNINNAIIGYQRINQNYMGYISYSAPAMKRQMELLYQRNQPKPDLDKPSDRLIAYLTGSKYIKFTQPNFDKMTVSDRNDWREVEALVQKYEQDQEIMAENKAAEERAKAKAEALKR